MFFYSLKQQQPLALYFKFELKKKSVPAGQIVN